MSAFWAPTISGFGRIQARSPEGRNSSDRRAVSLSSDSRASGTSRAVFPGEAPVRNLALRPGVGTSRSTGPPHTEFHKQPQDGYGAQFMGTQRSGSASAQACGFFVAAATLAYGPPARAADDWGGSLGITTEYLSRGISQTRGAPAIQGGLHAKLPDGWIIGTWASTVDLNPGRGATYEIDLHVAKLWNLNEDWSARLGATHYLYPNDIQWRRYDYDEVSASMSYQSRIIATASWSPNTSRRSNDQFVSRRRTWAYELALLQPVTNIWSLAAGVGYYDLTDLFDRGYWYWNAGVTCALGGLQLDLSHINTDHTAVHLFGYDIAGNHWSAALTWRF